MSAISERAVDVGVADLPSAGRSEPPTPADGLGQAQRVGARSPADAEEVLVLSGLTKVYEPTPKWMRVLARTHIKSDVIALDGIDLTVRAGEICAIVGPNGAGKTTLFRIIVGLTTATSGEGTLLGLDVERDSEQIRQVVGWMPADDRSLLMRATARENLHMHGRLQGMSPRLMATRIPEVLATVDLESRIDTVVAGLSAGMKARLRLARALLSGPRVLILDEPTGAVDPIAAHGLLDLITDLVQRERLAVLISSHRLEEIEALRSQALLLDKGRVKYFGDLDSLREQWERPQLELVFASTDAADQAAADLTSLGLELTVDGPTLRCWLKVRDGAGDVLAALGAGARQVRHVREIPMPLRDLIARAYRHDQTAEGGAT
ncbi:ABC transporter ATP-binding protein [Micromonospora parathelypteridis]|uniref:ABC-2 type transport system ATP-binding protein n=1 Tax=Micromonospora parathelypteridis TaxID=1839617 RepID=A0A840VV55_9ACTN|nr:ABC transporter ATP-binding protein [Micromonospora parathelypteridis]MBB5480507.1 ABC-2 type transport system ATP-binding protein [Micromonospora parathelypteridis]